VETFVIRGLVPAGGEKLELTGVEEHLGTRVRVVVPRDGRSSGR
jgi:hypothetical protein